MPRPFRAWKWLGTAALLVVFATLPVRADLIFLKDGTVLQGKLVQETKIEFDSATKEPFRYPNGLFHIDEGACRRYFCQTQVAKVVSQKEGTSGVRILYPTKFLSAPAGVPPIHQVVDTEPWDAQWNRKIKIASQGHQATVQQHLSVLTPTFAKADSRTYFWAEYYLTHELGPEIVGQLIASNPNIADDPKLKEAERIARRFTICDFYVQTGWYEAAERELTKLATDFPKEKEQVEASRDSLRQARARDLFELIKRLALAGQYKAVKAALEAFPAREAAEVTAADFRAFKAAFDEAAGKYAETLRMLDDVAGGLKDAPEGMAAALAAVRAEMHPDRANRLEAFLGQALQSERQRKAGRTPEVSPAALAALAVTGLMLGGPSAEPKPETALRLWRSRELVLNYLRSDDAGIREKLLNDYEKRKIDFAGLDEICQLIPQLPPESAEPDIKPAAAELRAGNKNGPLYLVHLPPEYSHSRHYPVLLALAPYGEPAQYTLRRHEAVCAENGYILAVPRWEEKGSNGYTFSEREHQVVLDVLRDLRRRFQVDSDRVFLTGAGFGGGDMAFDVGLSHPDLFAGVLPMAAGPSYFSDVYWRSAQYLPFYIIGGDRSGEGNKKVRDLFNNWVPRGFNSLWVQYKGRGVEWLGGELPAAFDWMRNRRRAFPMRQLGTDGGGGNLGSEFYSMRQTDNHFYWLSTDEISPKRCNSFEGWNNRVVPATLTARIDPDKNEIYVTARGVRQVTVWLARNSKGESMIDFDKPVTVWGTSTRFSNRKVAPSLEVLLKDLAERGDRQQLFLARIDLKNS